MKFTRVIARFDAKNLSLAEELICDIFFSFHLKGVICDVPIEEPDEGFGTHTLAQPEIFSITCFLPLLDSSDVILEQIKEKAAALADLDITVGSKTDTVDEQDWSEAWKAYFEVTRVTDRITIKPDWKSYEPQSDEMIIHLDPGMAFGTGTHPTTAMCIQLIQTFLAPGSRFLDIGTGSGILMIAAQKLGAGHMTGIDIDEIAVDVAKKNLVKNNISRKKFDLFCAPLDQTDPGPYGFIAVNIIAQVIVDILPGISTRMTDETTAVLSGIIEDRQNDVVQALEAQGLMVIHEEQTDEWVALAIKKRPEPSSEKSHV